MVLLITFVNIRVSLDMKNPIHFDIEESLSELKNLRLKQPTLSKQKRVDCLLHLKTSKFKTRQELANHLGIHIRTQERWLTRYRTGGMASYISNEPQIRPSKIITCHPQFGRSRKSSVFRRRAC